MKKILFASTALVATAGIASADISLAGAAAMGLKYNDSAAKEKLIAHSEITLTVNMTGTTDGGLTFGADMTITNGGVGDVITYIEGGFGKLSAGSVGSAVDAMIGIGDLGYDGIGVDNVAEAQIDAADKGTLMYKGTFGDFTIGASYNMSTDHAVASGEDFSIAMQYAMGDYKVGLGYDDMNDAITVGLGANVADFAVNGVITTSDIGESYGLTAGYTMGATTITAAYAKNDTTVAAGKIAAGAEAYGLGVSYDLGGGAKVGAAIGEVGGATVADLGISMSF